MRIIRLNDLYFPNGNEIKQYYEKYYEAISETDSIHGYGSTPKSAVDDYYRKKTENDSRTSTTSNN